MSEQRDYDQMDIERASVAVEIAALRDQLAAMREALEIATRYVGHDPDCDGFESMGHCHCDYTTLKNVWERPFTDTAAAGQAWRERVRVAGKKEMLAMVRKFFPDHGDDERYLTADDDIRSMLDVLEAAPSPETGKDRTE